MSKGGIFIFLLFISVVSGGLILPVAGYEEGPDAGGTNETGIPESNATEDNITEMFSSNESGTPEMLGDVEHVITCLVQGRVLNAMTGEPIEGALISVGGKSANSNVSGEFEIPHVPGGSVSVQFGASPLSGDKPLNVSFQDLSSACSQEISVTCDGYIDLVYDIDCKMGSSVYVNPVLVPAGMDCDLTAVLTWGEDPEDLDSWLMTPEIEGLAYKVYYSDEGSLTEAPYAELDIDDTSSFGPETITIGRSFPGLYRYYIHWYDGSGTWTTSNATVNIYQDSSCIGTYSAPRSSLGEDSYWEVFEYDGMSKMVTPVNRIITTEPSVTGTTDAVNEIETGENTVPCWISSWEWDFGDGTPGSDQRYPTHTYEEEGSYDVTLTISSGISSYSRTKYDYIKVTVSPNITSVTPSAGENTGTITTDLEGSDFKPGATVKLVRNGLAEIPGTGVSVDDSGTQITCNFDLTDAPAGNMTVVVTNPDGKTGRKVDCFNVIDVIPPELISFSSPSPDGEYGVGSTIDICAAYSEELKSGSNVKINLNTGAEVLLDQLSFSEINPVSVGRISNPDLEGAAGVFVRGDYAYVASCESDSFEVIDISSPAHPVKAGSISNDRLNGAFGVYVSGDYAYVTGSNSNCLEIIEISSPESPVEAGSISNGNLNGAYGVFVSGGYAYVASKYGDALDIINISDPENPVEAGSISNDNLNGASGVFVSGGYAYVASKYGDALVIIDISDPALPFEAGSISNDNLEYALGVFVSGDYAYVTAMDAGALVIIDISDPENPVEAGSISNDNLDGAFGVSVAGGYAYVTGMYSGALVIIDISDPENPVEAGLVSNGYLDMPCGVDVSGNHVYVTSMYGNSLGVIQASEFNEISGSYTVATGRGVQELDVQSIISQHAEDPSGNINSLTTLPPVNIADRSEIAVDGGFEKSFLIPPELTPADQDILFIAGWGSRPDSLTLDFGDGTNPYTSSSFGNATSVNINHTYRTPGVTYTAVLTLSLNGTEVKSVSTPVTVIQPVPEKIADETSTMEIPGTVVRVNGNRQQILVNESDVWDSGGDVGTPDNLLTVKKSDQTILKIKTEGAPGYKNGNYTGNVTGVTMIPPGVNASIGGRVGAAGVDFSVTMGDYQSGARIETSIGKDVAADARNAFTLACPGMTEVAYTVYFTKSGFTNYSSIREATINFSVKTSWVDSIGGNENVRIVRWKDDGTSVSYNPVFIGFSGENSVYQVTTDGFSVYGVVSAPPAISGHSGSGGGHSNAGIGLILDLKSGDKASVSMDKTAVTEVSVWPEKEIPEFMVTVERKSGVLKSMEPGALVYEYDFSTLYKANSSDLSKVVYTFKIPKNWLEDNKAVPGMMYYDEGSGEWNELPVQVTGEDNYLVFAEAEAPGFGLLAIVGSEPSSSHKEDDTTVTEKITPEVTPAPEETGDATGSKPTPEPFFMAIPALCIGLIIIMRRR